MPDLNTFIVGTLKRFLSILEKGENLSSDEEFPTVIRIATDYCGMDNAALMRDNPGVGPLDIYSWKHRQNLPPMKVRKQILFHLTARIQEALAEERTRGPLSWKEINRNSSPGYTK